MGTKGNPRRANPSGALESEVAAVYREHAASLCRQAAGFRPESVQDAVQEAFLRYFVARAGGKRIEDPGAWLRRVMRNLLADAVRSPAARAEVAPESAPEAREPGVDPETACTSAETLARALRVLAPREMQCMTLRIQGLRYRQIGELLEIRTGTVSALLARAYRKIRELEPAPVQAFRAT